MMNPTCRHCTTSEERHWLLFDEHCSGCRARRIARGPAYHRVRGAGKLDPEYIDLVNRNGVTHAQVKAAAAADFQQADAR